jgi:hypothetical protein
MTLLSVVTLASVSFWRHDTLLELMQPQAHLLTGLPLGCDSARLHQPRRLELTAQHRLGLAGHVTFASPLPDLGVHDVL